MKHSKYTQEERPLAVQYYLASYKGMSECAEELGLQDHDIKNWICRDEIEPAPKGVTAEELKEAFWKVFKKMSRNKKSGAVERQVKEDFIDRHHPAWFICDRRSSYEQSTEKKIRKPESCKFQQSTDR